MYHRIATIAALIGGFRSLLIYPVTAAVAGALTKLFKDSFYDSIFKKDSVPIGVRMVQLEYEKQNLEHLNKLFNQEIANARES